MENAKIRDIEVYHGKNIVGNDYYIEHFKKQGKDVRKFFEEVLGRKYRYEVDRDKENALTMAIEASHAVLKKSKLTGKDIDMIIYASVLPQYTSPTSALIIHSSIKGKPQCFCHDMNGNCIGMTYALDLANRYIATNPEINKVLLVGCDYITPQVSPNDDGCYGQYGDASCALILERTNEDCKLLDVKITINDDFIDYVRFPKCGFAHIYDAPKEDMYVKWKPFNAWWIDGAIENINTMLHKNNLSVNDVSMFCFSQIAIKNIEIFREKMGISEEKSLYIGDTYGYTGTTSPFIALYEGIKRGQVKRGDYVVLCTVAAGSVHISLLLKY